MSGPVFAIAPTRKKHQFRWLLRYTALAIITSGPVLGNEVGPLLVSVVRPIGGTMILADTAPLGTTTATVAVVACKGEYEAASVVLRTSSKNLTHIEVRSSDLVNADTGAAVAAGNVDIRVVKPWFQSFNAWSDISKNTPDDFRQKLVPELLLKDDSLVVVDENHESNLIKVWKDDRYQYRTVNPKKLATSEQVMPGIDEFPVKDSDVLRPFTLPADTNKQIWITLHVPNEAQPGDYVGRLQFRSDGALIGSIPLQLRVLPFVLAAPRIAYSIYYRGQLNPKLASIGSEYKTIEQMRHELVDMDQHGVSNPGVYQEFDNAAALQMALQLRQEVGLSGPLFYLGIQTTESSLGSPESTAKRNVQRILPVLTEISRRYGFAPVFIYGRDEAKGPALAAQKTLWRAVHDAGGKIFVAGSTGAHPLVGDLLDTFVHYGKPDFREAARWHASGGKIFNYANPQSGPENPFLFRLNYGVILWANDYDGAMPYAYQHCFGSCWSDIDDPVYRDHNFTYPTADGLIPTLAWEGYREAVDDVRYVTTLERLLSEAPDKNSLAVETGRNYLDKLREALRNGQGPGGKYNQGIAIDLDAVRSEVVLRIGALVQK